ncbi:MAG: hypothetical protein HY207_07385 [Nitrospirae bacterium]|nr:hypothetical protein [Nitrospirota bacterium]
MNGSEKGTSRARSRPHRYTSGLIGWPVFAFVFGANVAWADAPLTLTVYVVQATHGARAIDPALAFMKRELAILSYSRYDLLEIHTATATIGRQQAIPLPGYETIKLYPYGISDGSLELLVMLIEENEKLIETTFRLAQSGTILIGGPAYHDGVLILAISDSF